MILSIDQFAFKKKTSEPLIYFDVNSSERGHAEFDTPYRQNIRSTKQKERRTDTKRLTSLCPIEHHGDEKISMVITHG